jgi:hypothetical protein
LAFLRNLFIAIWSLTGNFKKIKLILKRIFIYRNVCFNIKRYLLLLAFPFGVSFLLSFVYFIFDAEIIPELDENIWPILNNSIDLNNSVYIALRAVS